MDTEEKKICPRCNFLGTKEDNTCPYCGIKLISECPKCGARIKSAFSEYCYFCGIRFADTIRGNSRSKQLQSAHFGKQNKKGGGNKKRQGDKRDREKRRHGDDDKKGVKAKQGSRWQRRQKG